MADCSDGQLCMIMCDSFITVLRVYTTIYVREAASGKSLSQL